MSTRLTGVCVCVCAWVTLWRKYRRRVPTELLGRLLKGLVPWSLRIAELLR